jgi:hypothetical protein
MLLNSTSNSFRVDIDYFYNSKIYNISDLGNNYVIYTAITLLYLTFFKEKCDGATITRY